MADIFLGPAGEKDGKDQWQTTAKTTNAFGNVIDYTLESGLGVRLSASTGDFIGFFGERAMRTYAETIEQTRLVREVESISTTGDVEYDGTALEIADKSGVELFHVVVDSSGERQIMFFACREGYRMPVDLMQRVLTKALELVVPMESRER